MLICGQPLGCNAAHRRPRCFVQHQAAARPTRCLGKPFTPTHTGPHSRLGRHVTAAVTGSSDASLDAAAAQLQPAQSVAAADLPHQDTNGHQAAAPAATPITTTAAAVASPAGNGASSTSAVPDADHTTNSSSSSGGGSSTSSHLKRRRIARADVPRLLMGRELQRVWTLAVPLMINNIAGYALSIIGAVFIGRLGALPLSASVLANSVYNCTGLSLAYGLSAGMETLCGQAYGAGVYKRVGVILQRALLVCWTVCIVVAVLWSQSHSVLVQLGQQPDIAALASRYLIFCIPCLFLTVAIECIRKYLQSQRAVKPAMAIAAVTLGVSPLFFWLLVEKLSMGLDGAALAFVTCQATTLAGLVGYVVYRSYKLQGKKEQTWGGWSGEALKDWPEYCSYGMPAAAMISLEWWAYEVIILMAGLLPNAEVALSIMGIMLNINAWVYMLPMGLGAAVNTSISNAMGAGHASTAKRAFLTGIGSGAFVQACLCMALLAGGQRLVGVFTTDAAVIKGCAAMMPLLALLVFFDGLNGVVAGVLRGSGRQLLGAAINGLGYWVIGIPLAAFLAFPGNLGVHGFWIGITVGAFVQAVVLLVILFRWDWKREVERVQQLLRDAAASGKIVPSYGH